jgi:hypothetical protein
MKLGIAYTGLIQGVQKPSVHLLKIKKLTCNIQSAPPPPPSLQTFNDCMAADRKG